MASGGLGFFWLILQISGPWGSHNAPRPAPSCGRHRYSPYCFCYQPGSGPRRGTNQTSEGMTKMGQALFSVVLKQGF